ncbi:hypothetical protein Ddc_21549 [Ditylenchus destructor]|nr:hypothetical protein Ddc_21549 [Ditylenchus destructor]
MVKLIEKCPEILYESDPRTMDQTLTDMTGFFSTKMIRRICHKTPFATLMSPSDLKSRCEYIHGHMGFEPEDFVDASGWALLDLREIMIRHDLLRKTGKYNTPDEKRPQFKMDNPTMDRILDTDDVEFATKVVGISYEELLTFRELCEQIEANSDKEKPYERINAKQRKAFDRQEKPMPCKVPGSMEDFDAHHSIAE